MSLPEEAKRLMRERFFASRKSTEKELQALVKSRVVDWMCWKRFIVKV